jgi:hypothetical protein
MRGNVVEVECVFCDFFFLQAISFIYCMGVDACVWGSMSERFFDTSGNEVLMGTNDFLTTSCTLAC